MVAHTVAPVPGDPTPYLASIGTRHACSAQNTRKQNVHTHKIKTEPHLPPLLHLPSQLLVFCCLLAYSVSLLNDCNTVILEHCLWKSHGIVEITDLNSYVS